MKYENLTINDQYEQIIKFQEQNISSVQIMKKDTQMRQALEVKDQNINISQNKQQQIKKSRPKSQRKTSCWQGYSKKSHLSKQKSQIPSLSQAKLRQKQIVKFHNRNFYQRQRRLQQIFKQNCRIYIQLNKQKSYYSKNFNKQQYKKPSSNKSHFISYSDYNSTKIFQHQKMEKFLSNNNNIKNNDGSGIDDNNNKFQRRYSLSIARPNKQYQLLKQKKKKLFLGDSSNKNSVNIQSQMAIQLRRYEKNKTQMLPRKDMKLNLQNAKDLYSFIQNKSNRNSDLAGVKNPVYIRFKRRPNSGFRC